jgi:hypothetical protein
MVFISHLKKYIKAIWMGIAGRIPTHTPYTAANVIHHFALTTMAKIAITISGLQNSASPNIKGRMFSLIRMLVLTNW